MGCPVTVPYGTEFEAHTARIDITVQLYNALGKYCHFLAQKTPK